MEPLLFIVSIMAIWRIVSLLLYEEGPFAIFERLRARVYQLEDKPGGISRGFGCFDCMSIWVSIAISSLLFGDLPNLLMYILSLSTGAIMLNTLYLFIKQRDKEE